jgi:preprotein translocase subunit SecE
MARKDPDHDPLSRDNVPGSLDHASGEVDEFEAALVAGAEGETVEDREQTDERADDTDAEMAEAQAPDRESQADPEATVEDTRPVAEPDAADFEDEDEDGYEDEDADDHDERERAAPGASRTLATSRADVPATRSGPGRFAAFVRASWAELQRVQWPDRRQVAQATAVVLGFVVIAGAYLGLADGLAQELVDLIL